ncbi:MAG: hypothetical protein ACK501_10365 [Planctomycetota bacterium]|jgi:hypothetical protein
MSDRFDRLAGGDAARGHDAGGDAMPPFPSEAGWLDQPLPPELADVDLGAFVARTLDAVRDEQQLDRDLAALDRELPRIVLAAHELPSPAPDFVPSVLAALHQDRRARWQQLLAKHIAPEPSLEFVARTLTALRETAPAAASAPAPAAPQHPRLATTPTRPGHAADATFRPWRRRGPWLAAAAAALLAVVLLRRDAIRPLEARLAEQVPPIEAHAAAGSPLAFVLAEHERRRAPDAIAAGNADGVWLQLAGGR